MGCSSAGVCPGTRLSSIVASRFPGTLQIDHRLKRLCDSSSMVALLPVRQGTRTRFKGFINPFFSSSLLSLFRAGIFQHVRFNPVMDVRRDRNIQYRFTYFHIGSLSRHNSRLQPRAGSYRFRHRAHREQTHSVCGHESWRYNSPDHL